MVKPDIKTPNKRKSIAKGTPAKKVKVENDSPIKKIKSPAQKVKVENDSPIKKINSPAQKVKVENDSPAKTIKVENGNHKPFTPKKQNQGPKNNQQSIQKSNKTDKQGSEDSPKKIKQLAFAGTKQLKKEQKPKTGAATESQGPKKKRKSAFSNLISKVKANEGSKDAETLKNLEQRIQAILSRGELTKTAKKKLSLLNKLKSICQDGAAKTAERTKQATETAKEARLKKKADKLAAAPQPEQKTKKQAVKAAPKVEDNNDEDSEEEDSDEEESGAEEEGTSDEVEGEEDSGDEEDDDDDEEEEDDEEEDDDDDDDDSDEEEAPAPKKNPEVKQANTSKPEGKSKNIKQPSLDQLKSKEILKKGQKRFVLFVGNIPFDTTKQDIAGHFSKVGDIVDIRIPTEQGSNKPRGFAYIEVQNETAYEKCLSMHHSQLKGRRINVLYTLGGKKKGEDKKKETKAKNMKLHAMRRQGKLAGSIKETQKRSFRRNKGKNQQAAAEN